MLDLNTFVKIFSDRIRSLFSKAVNTVGHLNSRTDIENNQITTTKQITRHV
jgi:hypothetical protein